MPELPEVETIRRGLAPRIAGALIEAVVLNRANLRFAFPEKLAARLAGRTVVSVGRRAKYLLFALSDGATLVSHLGMTGSYRFASEVVAAASRYRAPGAAGVHDHVVMALRCADGGECLLVYNDPRRFGFFDLAGPGEESPYLAGLGIEPLGNEMNAEALAGLLAGRRAPIKALLLDQRIIAGLGNIYVCEALWRAGIAPDLPGARLVGSDGAPGEGLHRLTRAIREALAAALAAGGSTLRDFRNAEGAGGYFQHQFDVYGREGEPCHRQGCNGVVQRMVQSGRSSFYCPACQGK